MPQKIRTAVQDQRQIYDQRFQTLLQILEPKKELLNPSPDAKMLGALNKVDYGD